MESSDHTLTIRSGQGAKEAEFEQVFKSHFRQLHVYAFSFVKDRDLAEDMVQAAFCRLWERFGDLEIRHSVSAYLYRSVYHECLNHFKHLKVRQEHARHERHTMDGAADSATGAVEAAELSGRIQDALRALPEGCRTVFQLSRFESLRYAQIAEKLGISVKTVENQMGKALKILRDKLSDYLPLLMLLWILTTLTG